VSNFLDTVETPTGDLTELETLCTTLEDVRQDIKRVEEELSRLVKMEVKLSSEDIPMFLATKGINALELTNGKKILIKEEAKVSLPKRDLMKRKRALDFIRSNGGDGIIKHEIKIPDPADNMEVITEYLSDRGVSYNEIEDIHPQTLKGFFNDILGLKKNSIQRVNIGDIPEDLNVFVYKKTTIV